MSRKSSGAGSSQISSNDSNAYPYIGKCVLSYSGVRDRLDIMSFIKGEEIKIIGEYISGWLIAARDEEQGYVPSKYILKVKNVDEPLYVPNMKPKKSSLTMSSSNVESPRRSIFARRNTNK
eukprot:TRINITY_DN6415_c0_g1_i2.p1 TRINITY_DN6415_c0_g1~~TRINITY_DN6415_c0_g1_i2.p1  ORF type:complete len:131 (+),score=18.87 TRINITY_DN6415_c0_g1_i2:32-394(+)